MTPRNAVALVFILVSSLSCFTNGLCQSQTTGRIVGTVKDQRGAIIVAAEIEVTSLATAQERKVTTDADGNYTVLLLSPGSYRVRVMASGFAAAAYEPVRVVIT